MLCEDYIKVYVMIRKKRVVQLLFIVAAITVAILFLFNSRMCSRIIVQYRQSTDSICPTIVLSPVYPSQSPRSDDSGVTQRYSVDSREIKDTSSFIKVNSAHVTVFYSDTFD